MQRVPLPHRPPPVTNRDVVSQSRATRDASTPPRRRRISAVNFRSRGSDAIEGCPAHLVAANANAVAEPQTS